MLDKLILKYKEHMELESSISHNSLKLYISDIRVYSNYLKEKGIISFEKIDRNEIVQYFLDMQKEGKAASTLARNLSSLKSFHRYLYDEGVLMEDPTVNLKAPKIETRVPEILTVDEVTELIEILNGDSFKEKRDRAMLELLYGTGIRINELIDLNIEDIDFDTEYLLVKSEDEERVIPIGKPAIKAIKEYLHLFHDLKEVALFVNNRGDRITRQGFWKNLKGYVKELDLDKKITPQTLRQSFIVHLIENGADLKTIQEISGHANITSVQNYLDAIEKKDLRKIYNKAHPRA